MSEKLSQPEQTVEQNPEINPEVYKRILGFNALEYYVPQDPMDDLQCDSCQ